MAFSTSTPSLVDADAELASIVGSLYHLGLLSCAEASTRTPRLWCGA